MKIFTLLLVSGLLVLSNGLIGQPCAEHNSQSGLFDQQFCSGNSITQIVFDLTDDVVETDITFTSNPEGLTGTYSNNPHTFSISGSPTQNTNWELMVENDNCELLEEEGTIIVYSIPNAMATPETQTICSGTNITQIVLTGNVDGTTFEWKRDNTDNVTGIPGSGSGNISGTLTNATNNPVTVTFTITPKTNNCTGTSITATVVVNPRPTASAAPQSQTICSGNPIQTIVITGPVNNTIFNWTRNNTTVTGIPEMGSGNISGTLTNTTNNPVTVTFTITPIANGCTGTSITATVLVNSLPEVSLPQTTLCVGKTLDLSPSTGGTWISNDEDIAMVTTAGRVTAVAVGTVNFTFTNAQTDCSNTTPTLTVLAADNPNCCTITNNTITQPNPNQICQGVAITISGSPPDQAGGNYLWKYQIPGATDFVNAPGDSNNLTYIVPVNLPSGLYRFKRIYTLNQNCSHESNSVELTIKVKPTIEQESNVIVCQGDQVQVDFNTGPSGSTLSWKNDNSNIGLPAMGSTDILFTPTSPGLANISATSHLNGCNSNEMKFSINVKQKPPKPTGQTPQSVCYNGSSHSPSADPPAGGATLVWYDNQDNEVPQPSFINPGTYTVSVASRLNGCTSDKLIITFIIKERPDVSISIDEQSGANPDDGAICQGDTAVLQATINNNYTYNWGSNHPTSSAIIVTNAGIYTVTVTNNGCTNTASQTINVLSLPNIPEGTIDHVNCHGENNGSISLNLNPNTYDFEWNVDNAGNTNNLLNQPAGTYNVTVTNKSTECSATKSFEITQPTKQLQESAFSFDDNLLTLCNDEIRDIEAKIEGGTAPYSITGSYIPEGGGSSVNLSFSGFGVEISSPGVYTIIIKDVNMCQITKMFTVVQQEQLNLSFIQDNGDTTSNSFSFCDGSSTMITVRGADSYFWDDSTTNETRSFNSSDIQGNSEDFTVTGTIIVNNKACTGTETITIIKNPLPDFNFKYSVGNENITTDSFIILICKEKTIDTLSVNINNSHLYSFLWSQDSSKKQFILPQSIDVVYNVKVTENLTKCFSSDSVIIQNHNIPPIPIARVGESLPDTLIEPCYNTINSNENYQDLEIINSNTYKNIMWSIQGASAGQATIENITTTSRKIRFTQDAIGDTFSIVVTANVNSNNCEAFGEIKFVVVESDQAREINPNPEINCGLLIFDGARNVINSVNPLPGSNYVQPLENIDNVFFLSGSAIINYSSSSIQNCSFFDTITNNNQFNLNSIIEDTQLAYDTCGGVLLAHHKEGYCYKWYKINANGSAELEPKSNSSILNGIDTANQNNYFAIARPGDCKDENCLPTDTIIISTRSGDNTNDIGCLTINEPTISISPNPNNGQMKLVMQGFSNTEKSVFISNSVGTTIRNIVIPETYIERVFDIDLQGMTPGVYFVTVRSGDSMVHTRFIISN